MKKPLLLVLSAASGAGKSTLCRALVSRRADMVYSVSCTTRAPRGGEKDGESYHFLSEDTFARKVEEGAFLEYANVHGKYYGTLRETVERAMLDGKSIVLDIDVQGAQQLRETIAALPPDDVVRRGFVDVFVHAPSWEELRRRLEARGEDSAAAITVRLENARREVQDAGRYRYQVVNDELESALRQLLDIVDKEQAT